MNSQVQIESFEALNISRALCERLAQLKITIPTDIQAAAIPFALQGRDVIGLAQTGTGKTLAFGLPMAMNLRPGEVALVLAPTRELAQQIAESLDRLGLRCCLVVGGASMHRQIQELRRKPQVIVATPGRLIDHMNQKTVRLDRIVMAVLDEGDRMLDMGFAPAIQRILGETPRDRQTLLFSATMPDAVANLARQFMCDPERIEANPAGEASALIEHSVLYLPFEEKGEMLASMLHEHEGSILVFARTRHGARKLAKQINARGHRAAEIHSDRTLAQRREAIDGFKTGRYRILVATDIAARGIDVKGISLVLNYDLPDQPEDYVHRIGRTGRAGASGLAVSFALLEQTRLVREIEKILGADLPISERSTVLPPRARRREQGAPVPKSTSRPPHGPSHERGRERPNHGSKGKPWGRADGHAKPYSGEKHTGHHASGASSHGRPEAGNTEGGYGHQPQPKPAGNVAPIPKRGPWSKKRNARRSFR